MVLGIQSKIFLDTKYQAIFDDSLNHQIWTKIKEYILCFPLLQKPSQHLKTKINQPTPALFKSMENLTNNPNLSIDVGQNILKCLDDTSLQSCRLVNKSIKCMVEKPKFWLQKLEKKGLNPQFKSKTLTVAVPEI